MSVDNMPMSEPIILRAALSVAPACSPERVEMFLPALLDVCRLKRIKARFAAQKEDTIRTHARDGQFFPQFPLAGACQQALQ